jgi:GntR family transcriptional regulator
VIEKSGRPAYLQVADDLRKLIRSGELAVGQPLPSMARLAKRYEVSVGVIKSTISVLRTEGIVIGQQGKAVYVRDPEVGEQPAELDAAAANQQLTEILETLRDLSLRMARLESEVFPTQPRTPPAGN